MAESSDVKFLNTCGRLLDIFSADAKWNPSNAALKIPALTAMHASGQPFVTGVVSAKAPHTIKINDLQAAFDKIEPRVRASRRYFKSCGASDAELKDANTIINKLLGDGKKPKPVNPDQPGGAAQQSHSTSHLSYDSRLGNLTALREYYANVSAYQPNETDIKLDGFDALIAECQTALGGVDTAFVPYFEALNQRDAKLYDDADSILEIYRDSKEYYKSLYAPNTPQYRAITAPDMKLVSNSRS